MWVYDVHRAVSANLSLIEFNLKSAVSPLLVGKLAVGFPVLAVHFHLGIVAIIGVEEEGRTNQDVASGGVDGLYWRLFVGELNALNFAGFIFNGASVGLGNGYCLCRGSGYAR